MARHATNQNLLFTTIGLTLAGAFVADLVAVLGVAAWVFYLGPVALTLYTWKSSAPLWIGLGCTGLLVAGVFLSPPA